MLKWVLSGATEHDIAEAVRTTWPDQEPRPLIGAVMEGLSRSADFDPRCVIGWAFEATRDLYRRMVDVADYTGALRAVKQLTELTRHVPDRPDADLAEAEPERAAEAGGEPEQVRPAQEASGSAPAPTGEGRAGDRPATRRRKPGA